MIILLQYLNGRPDSIFTTSKNPEGGAIELYTCESLDGIGIVERHDFSPVDACIGKEEIKARIRDLGYADVEYYMGLKWQYRLMQEENGEWQAWIEEFVDCNATETNVDAAIYRCRSRQRQIIETRINNRQHIPTPK